MIPDVLMDRHDSDAGTESVTARWILHKWIPGSKGTQGHWIVKCSLCRQRSAVETDRCRVCGAQMIM